MKLPIALALGWPARVAGAASACDFATASTWEFEPLDDDVFPAVALAREAGQPGRLPDGGLQRRQRRGGRGVPRRAASGSPRSCEPSPTVLHAADQWSAEPATVDDVLDAQDWARDRARRAVDSRKVVAHPMMFVIGIVLFALAILLSVALHECGHMWVARATGMKVRRYFVGFGPTLWSTTQAQQAGVHRVRRQGRPARRLLRHRGHDVGGGTRARRAPLRDVQAEDVEAGRGAVRGARHELRHRPGADLRHRDRLGPAQPASAHHRRRRRNRLRRSANQQGPGRRVHWPRPGCGSGNSFR